MKQHYWDVSSGRGKHTLGSTTEGSTCISVSIFCNKHTNLYKALQPSILMLFQTSEYIEQMPHKIGVYVNLHHDCIQVCMLKNRSFVCKILCFISQQWGYFIKQKTNNGEWKENWQGWYIRALRVLSLFWYGVERLDAGKGETEGSDTHTRTHRQSQTHKHE